MAGFMAVCVACGAYGSERGRLLRRPCAGVVGHRADALRAVSAGRHPGCGRSFLERVWALAPGDGLPAPPRGAGEPPAEPPPALAGGAPAGPPVRPLAPGSSCDLPSASPPLVRAGASLGSVVAARGDVSPGAAGPVPSPAAAVEEEDWPLADLLAWHGEGFDEF